jgi:hypothetical protein
MNTQARAAEHPRDEWIPCLARQHRSPPIKGGPKSTYSSITTHSPEISNGRHIQAIFGSFIVWPKETSVPGMGGHRSGHRNRVLQQDRGYRGRNRGQNEHFFPNVNLWPGTRNMIAQRRSLLMSNSDRLFDCLRCRRSNGNQGDGRWRSFGPTTNCPFAPWAIRSSIIGRLALDPDARRARGRQLLMELVVWVSLSRSTCARRRVTKPSTWPPEFLIAEAYSARRVSAMLMPSPITSRILK